MCVVGGGYRRGLGRRRGWPSRPFGGADRAEDHPGYAHHRPVGGDRSLRDLARGRDRAADHAPAAPSSRVRPRDSRTSRWPDGATCCNSAAPTSSSQLKAQSRPICGRSATRAAGWKPARSLAMVPILRPRPTSPARCWTRAPSTWMSTPCTRAGCDACGVQGGQLQVVHAAQRSSGFVGGRWRIRAGGHRRLGRPVSGQRRRRRGATRSRGLAGVAPLGLEPRRRTGGGAGRRGDFAVDPWPMCCDVDNSLYFKPDAGRLLVSAMDQTPSPPCDAFADDMDVAESLHRFETGRHLAGAQARCAPGLGFGPSRRTASRPPATTPIIPVSSGWSARAGRESRPVRPCRKPRLRWCAARPYPTTLLLSAFPRPCWTRPDSVARPLQPEIDRPAAAAQIEN